MSKENGLCDSSYEGNGSREILCHLVWGHSGPHKGSGMIDILHGYDDYIWD